MRELGTWMPSDLGSHNRSAHWSRMTSFWTEPASFRANQSQAIVFPSVAPQSLRFVFNDSSACCVVFDEFQFRFFSFHFACSAWLDIAFLILHVSRTISPFFGGGVQGKEQVFFFARFLRFLSVLLLLVVDGMAWFCCSTTRWWLGSKKPGRSPFSFRFFSVASARVETGWGWGWSDCFFFRYGGHFHRFIGDPAQAKDVRSRRQRPRCSCRGNATTTTTRPALRTRPSSRASSRSGSRTKSTRSTRRPPTPSSVSQDPVHRRRGIPFTLKPSKTR